MDSERFERALSRIAHEILEQHAGGEEVLLCGIHTRGWPLAQNIAKAVHRFEGQNIPCGELDIGLYRDDLAQRPTPALSRTQLPEDPTRKTVILVDDVLFTGRTVRAALDALSDLGRPNRIELAVLVDRGHRQLPIRPDYVGMNLPTSSSQRVIVRVPEIDQKCGVWVTDMEEQQGRSPKTGEETRKENPAS